MEDFVHLNCACGHCGGSIEYPPQTAGQVVACPHCREKSRLPGPEPPNLAVPDDPHEPPVTTCPDCGAVSDPQAATCPACAARRGRNRLLAGLVLALVLLTAGSSALWALNKSVKPPPPRPKAGTTMILTQPPVKLPKSLNDLKPKAFRFEPRRGNVPAFVTGDVQNDSDNVHVRVRVELNLLDVKGAKIGVISDVITAFKPHSTWHIVVNVNDPKAAGVRYVGLKEDQ